MKKSLFAQVYTSFLVVIILSLTGVGLVSYWQSSKALDEQVEKYISQLINYTTSQTEQVFRRYELSTDSLLSEQDVKEFLEIDPQDNYQYYEYRLEILKNIFQKMFIAYPSIHMITVIGDHGKAIIDDNQNMSNYPDFQPEEMLHELNARVPNDGKIAIFKTENAPHNKETITIARRIRGFSSYETRGVLAMEVRSDQFSSLWNTADLGSEARFFILDEQGGLVFESETNASQHWMTDSIVQQILQEEDVSFVEPELEQLYVSRESDYLGWKMVITLPIEELRQPVSTIRSTTLIVGAMTLTVALFVAYRFARSITRPIRTLTNGMKETEQGIWNKIEQHQRDDEIGALIHRYNLMVSRLSEMIEKVYEAELHQQKAQIELQQIRFERQNAEFQALQLQINPHFLYNTLETINCYAIVQDSEEISEIVEAMAFMLRYSVQTHLEEITLVNELNHVRNYMMIMSHRLGREFEIDVAVPPKYLLHNMVRLTLQPLVENVFQHAFKDGVKQEHFIRIDARLTEEYFIVTVEDNGIGMDEERLATIRHLLECSEEVATSHEQQKSILKRGGIGVRNVHRRIQMVYGEAYGLFITSKLGQGTTITMRMPKKTQINEM